MTCHKIKDGYLCMDDDFVNLAPYGARIWMSWHHYLGPTFYRSEAAIKPIISPSKKTWDAFERWMNREKEKAMELTLIEPSETVFDCWICKDEDGSRHIVDLNVDDSSIRPKLKPGIVVLVGHLYPYVEIGCGVTIIEKGEGDGRQKHSTP